MHSDVIESDKSDFDTDQ